MTKVSFNAQALGIARHEQDTNMSHALLRGAFESVMVCRPGIEAITEGLGLANVQGFKVAGDKPPTGDVDT